MIPKILFLALFCAAHVQGRPASSPRENPDRVVNTWSDVGNTDYKNKNFNPNDSGNYNSDVNAGHNVVIVNSRPYVIKNQETYHQATNDNANNIPVNHHAQPTVIKKIATTKPGMEINIKTNMLKGRPAISLHEKPHRVINVWSEVDNTDHVKENSRPNDGGHYNSDVNGGHNIVIVDSPPEVYEKIETVEVAPNDNTDYIVVHHRAPTIVREKIVTARPVTEVAPNDNTDYIVVHHRAPTIVREKIVTARPVTEERPQKSPVEQFADKFGHSFGLVVEDNIHNVGREAESLFDVGRSVENAKGTILDSKAKLLVSVPRVKESFFGALG